jgi:hypothetical protein
MRLEKRSRSFKLQKITMFWELSSVGTRECSTGPSFKLSFKVLSSLATGVPEGLVSWADIRADSNEARKPKRELTHALGKNQDEINPRYSPVPARRLAKRGALGFASSRRCCTRVQTYCIGMGCKREEAEARPKLHTELAALQPKA